MSDICKAQDKFEKLTDFCWRFSYDIEEIVSARADYWGSPSLSSVAYRVGVLVANFRKELQELTDAEEH